MYPVRDRADTGGTSSGGSVAGIQCHTGGPLWPGPAQCTGATGEIVVHRCCYSLVAISLYKETLDSM